LGDFPPFGPWVFVCAGRAPGSGKAVQVGAAAAPAATAGRGSRRLCCPAAGAGHHCCSSLFFVGRCGVSEVGFPTPPIYLF
jgi:hypothetical protein